MSAGYRVVCYKRFECPGPPMTWAEAVRERQCLQLTHRDNFYVIEEVKE